MTEENHAQHAATGPLRLTDLADELIDGARSHHSHRAARTIHSSPSLRATVIALAAGAELAEHEAPPAATLHVIRGEVRLRWADQECLLRDGEIIPCPDMTRCSDGIAWIDAKRADIRQSFYPGQSEPPG